MNVLLWHGFLLTGSGSNVYTANLARALRRAGHDVLLMCQERRIEHLDFVDSHGDFDELNRTFDPISSGIDPAAGSCTLVRPFIHGLLPVYVFDRYEGFEVKTFVELDDAELDRYVEDNLRALVTAIERHGPDAILVGHEVMGPYIAARARALTGIGYSILPHGSALEFAVKRQARYRDYAIEGFRSADVVIGGSHYMIEACAAAIPGAADRATVVNPGCDVELFRPATRRPQSDRFRVGFVGKLMPEKGPHHLIAALGLTSGTPIEVTIVGYGSFEEDVRELARALHAGRLDDALALAGRLELEPLRGFLAAVPNEAAYVRRFSEIEIGFTGRLEHGPLSRLLPTFDVLVAPSVVVEAFGMVVAEAAACGVLPLVPDHSGIGEAGATLERALGAPGLLRFDPDDPVRAIAAALDRLAALSETDRAELSAAAVRAARERWSWDRVASGILRAISAG